jgi:hypothetical protein
LEVFNKGLDGEGFVVYALNAVVVVIQLCAWGGVLFCEAEGVFNVRGADGVEPDVFAVGPVILGKC